MSGFIAILNGDGSPADPFVLRRLTDFLAFRGPNEQHVWSDGPVGLGHTLLRTTRVDHERQPLSLDGVWIAADARVDARRELLDALAHEAGNRPVASLDVPDAELILRAYLAWGQNCTEHLIGDFSFAIWDGPRRRLFCARDQMGVKPLYYARAGPLLICGNTLDCIRLHPAVSDQLSDPAIADFLLFDMVRDPGRTSFEDILRLPPAHVLTSEQGNISIRRYWTLPAPAAIHYQHASEYVEHFRELLGTAVADRLRTDSAGVLMSGGLDSPIVAASAQRAFSSASDPGLRAYTDVFDHLILHEERHYATLVAEALKIPIEFRGSDASQVFGHAERHSPEPVHSAWPDSTADHLSHVAVRSRVALTGFGGDPLLSSLLSAHFRELLKKKQFVRALADAVRYLATDGRFSRLYVRKRWRRWFPSRSQSSFYPGWLNPDLEKRLSLRDRWEALDRAPASNGAARSVAYEQTASGFWPILFEGYDSGTTRVPVEVRHPFFDLRVVHFLLALPTVPWCCDKELLREAGRGTLPDAVRLRRKSPLQDDPLVALVQRPESEWVDHFEGVPELEPYVLRSRIPTVFQEKNAWAAWIHLRPLSLNFWLRARNAPER